MINELTLLSGNDIPFPLASLSIHQPTIKEIGFIGEDKFFKGLELLRVSKDSLGIEDQAALEQIENYDIFLLIAEDKRNTDNQSIFCDAQMVLALLFPNYSFEIMSDGIKFYQSEKEIGQIKRKDFPCFQDILKDIFNLQGKNGDGQDYNPANELARQIAEKLKKGRAAAAQSKQQDLENVCVYGRYISILTIGLKKNMNDFMSYTVYQLLDEFERYTLWEQYDMNIKAGLAGGNLSDNIEDWKKNLRE